MIGLANLPYLIAESLWTIMEGKPASPEKEALYVVDDWPMNIEGDQGLDMA